MRKTFVIASREYQAAVRTKSFLISLLILPLMMGGSILMQLLLKDQVDTQEKRFAIVDRTPGERLFPLLEQAVQVRNEKQIYDPQTGKQTGPVFTLERISPSADTPPAVSEQRFDLSERVRQKALFGFVEIGPDVVKDVPGNLVDERSVVRYQSNSPTYDVFPRWLEMALSGAIHEARGVQAGLSPAKLRLILQPVPLLSRNLSIRDPKTGAIVDGSVENPIVAIAIPGGLMILMFMMVIIGATPLMQGVVEEKMQRIAEVLLGSVRPFELMMGKLLGMVGVSLTLAAVYLGAAYWAAHRYHVANLIPVEILVWFVVFQVLAVLMYGSLFIAIGAACTDMKETQSLMWPVMLLASLPLFVWINVVREPNSPFSHFASLFPFATPMLMIGRQAVPPGVAWWQPVLGVALVLLTTTLCVYAAGRIFRVGILMQGKGAQIGELLKWVIHG
jgi:ABC-2 type transport system permease protein